MGTATREVTGGRPVPQRVVQAAIMVAGSAAAERLDRDGNTVVEGNDRRICDAATGTAAR